jgi:hypothetical protein
MWQDFKRHIRDYLGNRTLQEIIDDCRQQEEGGDVLMRTGTEA